MKQPVDSPSPACRWWHHPAFVVVLFCCAVLIFIVNVVCLVSRMLPGRSKAPKKIQSLSTRFSRWFVKIIEVSGVGSVRFEGFDLGEPKPVIYVANHTGLLDAILLLAVLPGVAIVFKGKLRSSALMGWATSLPSFICNDEGLGLIRQGRSMLESGVSLLIFPEGTRTECPPVNPFKGGFASLSVKTGVPIQTILIDNPARILGKGHGYFSRYALPFRYHFRTAALIHPGVEETTSSLSQRIETYFRDHLTGGKDTPLCG